MQSIEYGVKMTNFPKFSQIFALFSQDFWSEWVRKCYFANQVSIFASQLDPVSKRQISQPFCHSITNGGSGEIGRKRPPFQTSEKFPFKSRPINWSRCQNNPKQKFPILELISPSNPSNWVQNVILSIAIHFYLKTCKKKKIIGKSNPNPLWLKVEEAEGASHLHTVERWRAVTEFPFPFPQLTMRIDDWP